jgi:hypothetical protein
MPIAILTDEEMRWLSERRRRQRLAQQAGVTPLEPMDAITMPELMGRLRRLIGDEAMSRDAGKWRNRANLWPRRVLALIGNLEQRLADGQPIRCPAAYAEKMWTTYCEPPEGQAEPAPHPSPYRIPR